MAAAYPVAARNARLEVIRTAANAGVGPAVLSFYNGTRPATGGAITTLMGSVSAAADAFQAATGGTMTANAFVASTIEAGVTNQDITWARLTDSDGNFVGDFDAGLAAGSPDIVLNSIVANAGLALSVSSFVITESNS